MAKTGTILFLCPHGAAKSVLAAAELTRLAKECGLPFRAESAGTDPDDAPAPAVVSALLRDGVDVSAQRPRLVTEEDIAGAVRIISLGCSVEELASPSVRITHWDDVPPVSLSLPDARAAIRQHVEALVTELERDLG